MKKTGCKLRMILTFLGASALALSLTGCKGMGNPSGKIFQEYLDNQIRFAGSTFYERYEEERDITGTDPEAFLYDVNEDGDEELLVYTMFYGFDIYDVVNGELSLLTQGEGTTGVCGIYEHDGHTFVSHSDFTHQGRLLQRLTRYNAAGEVVEEHNINAEYWDAEDDRYHEDSDFTYDGETITMEEYENYMNSYQMVDPAGMKDAQVLSR